jgi:hypothetical protein
MALTLAVRHRRYRKQRANLASRPNVLKKKHFRNFYGGAVVSNCRMPGTRNGSSGRPNDTSEVSRRHRCSMVRFLRFERRFQPFSGQRVRRIGRYYLA